MYQPPSLAYPTLDRNLDNSVIDRSALLIKLAKKARFQFHTQSNIQWYTQFSDYLLHTFVTSVHFPYSNLSTVRSVNRLKYSGLNPVDVDSVHATVSASFKQEFIIYTCTEGVCPMPVCPVQTH